ncbi:MAG: hotdog domain-containing protein [Phycisphaerales bacterium]
MAAPRPNPSERRLALRVVTMPRDTNPYGTIFGGVILSYIDQAAFVQALCHGDFIWVTASIERVDFLAPVNLGAVVTLYTRTVRAGRTSVTIEVEVETQRDPAVEPVRVTTATTTLVALDAQGRPTPFAASNS